MKEPWELVWRDYYRELGVADDAGDDELQAAFRALARLHHPDAQTGKTREQALESERRFKLLVEAYEVLRDPARRAAYDDARSRSVGGAPPAPAISVDPPDPRVFSWNGDVVVRSHLTMPRGASHALLSVDCDDPRAELISADVTACEHGQSGVSDAVVRARLGSMRPHTLRIEYAAGAARTEQRVRAIVAPPPALWLGRMQARGGWTAMLLLTALLTLLAIPLARALAGTAGVVVVVGAACVQVACGLASSDRWHRLTQEGRGRIGGGRYNWRYIVGALVVANAAAVILRAVL